MSSKDYRFSLDKSRPTKLFRCIGCEKKSLKRYVDKLTGEFLHEDVGWCNRRIKCRYHYPPSQFFKDGGTSENGKSLYRAFPISNVKQENNSKKKFDTIPLHIYLKSQSHYETNNFFSFLTSLFHIGLATRLAEQFHLGTSKHWSGATVFWQVDKLGNPRTGKVMLYNRVTGKRVKKPFNHINWAHSILKQNDFQLRQCLFGEHQLMNAKPEQMIAVVESEKTAILMTAIQPKVIWLASGGLSNLSPEKFDVLKGRRIILYPDLGGFQVWKEKEVVLMNSGHQITTSNLLELHATKSDRDEGYDIADYFIKRDPGFGWSLTEVDGYPIFWDY